jgi:hypothetical protein
VAQQDPLHGVATNPERYHASFLSVLLESAQIEQIEALVAPPERCHAIGRNLDGWHLNATAPKWTALTTLPWGTDR